MATAPDSNAPPSAPKFNAHEIRAIAVRAMVDPRTVQSFLKGKKVHSTTEAIVRKAVDDFLAEKGK